MPGAQWVVASSYGGSGGVMLIRVSDRMSSVAYPGAAPKERLDAKTYNTCPGPPDAAFKAKFLTHGLYLQEGRNSVHKLYVVVHGGREAVEVFELDARPQTPTLTWIGCAVAPDPIGLNSVRALPGRRLHRHELPATQPADGGAPEGCGERRAVGMAHRERLAEGARQRSVRRQRARDVRGRQDAVRRGVGQPVVLPSLARRGQAGTAGSAARLPRRQHPLGARRLDSRRGSGRYGAELHDADREDRSEDAEGDRRW